ncbi:cytochrome P450 monooxygenase, putative [Acanthamoeba castellanii str. Neff]|uniref:Cytochrome P450 monooxygenase, putative n=1 Tax=Acanthamoeba castellanii (strain ATCC 30010 / Neff) TaxID=1257118 RepID=L8H8M1_ACACF|nr:cytochrome P450 monooxygenase, putative [Acanthamoeba castellanii str. Neff]ELR20816.1 cytochrome P450 monooxygenase, putative [Acanthamoeba castellanii str. Neff]
MLWSLIVAGVTVLLLALHLHHRKRKLDIPGPYQLPILCNLIDTFRHKHRLQDYMLEQASKGFTKLTSVQSPKGTFHFVLPFGGDTDVMVTDPPSVEYILKTNFENFTKGPHFKDKLQTLLGDGIFNTDGQPWKEQRCSNLMIGEIAFGFNVDSMHKDCSFSQAFDAAQECAVDRFLWPFWKFTPSPMASYVKILNDFAANVPLP